MGSRETCLLKDLINKYDAGEFNDFPAGSMFRMYPTTQHQEIKSVWWMPIEELRAFSQYRIKENEVLAKIMWGR